MRKRMLNYCWWLSGGTVQTLQTPEIWYDNLYNTQVKVYWSEGADSYEAAVASDSNFSSIIDSYSGTATNDTFTGLSADTQYYLRVRATKNGVTSEYATTSFYTMPTLVAAYLPPGMQYQNPGPITNEFAETSAGLIDDLFSIINTGGPTLSRVGANFSRKYTPIDLPYAKAELTGTTYFDFASAIALGTGAFTIIIKDFKTSSIGGAAQLFSDAVGGERVRLASTTQVYVRINASFSSVMTWPVAYTLGSQVDLIIECDGSTVRASITGGSTWTNSVTRPGSGAAFSFTRGAASNTGGNNCVFEFSGMFFAATQLTEAQRTRVMNWFKNSDYTNTANDFTIAPKNLPSTFLSDPVDGYINDYTGGLLLKGHGYGLSKNVWSWGDKYMIGVQKHFAAPDYSNSDVIFGDIANNKVYTPINMGFDISSADIHHVHSYHCFNNQLMSLKMNRHYGANEGSNIFVRRFWKDWNMMDFTTLPRAKEVAKQYFISDNQYVQAVNIGNTIGVFTQRRDPSSALPGRIQVSLSSDFLQSYYSEYTVFDTNTANNWAYPVTAYNGTRSEVYLFIEHVLAGVSPVQCEGISVIKTSDFITFSNIAETWSKNVVTGGAITLTELYANCAIIDARALTSTMIGHAYVTSGGLLYTIVGNGNNNGYTLYYQQQGQAAVNKTITFGGDSVVLGTQTDTTGTYQFAYHRSPIIPIYDGGTNWRVIAAQVNGGNWTPTVYQSTDGGDTWTKLGVVDGIDLTKQHTEFEISQNVNFNDGKGVFVCSAALSGTTAKPFVKSIDDLI